MESIVQSVTCQFQQHIPLYNSITPFKHSTISTIYSSLGNRIKKRKSLSNTYQRIKNDREACYKDPSKNTEAKEFVERMQKQKEEHLSHIKKVQEKENTIKAKQEEEQSEKQRKLKEEMALSKKIELQKRLQGSIQEAEERKKVIKRNLMTKPPSHSYLYEDWQKSYNLKISQELQEKLNAQKVYTNKHYKPLNRSEFDIHLEKIKENHHKKELACYDRIQSIKADHDQRKEFLDKFKTNISQKVIQMVGEEKRQLKLQKVNKLKNKMKMRTYSHIVKEAHMPSVNPEKAHERIQNISSIQSKKKEPKDKKDIPDYLHLLGVHTNKRSTSNKSKESSDTSTNVEKKGYTNYLLQQRKYREKCGKHKNDWLHELKDKSLSRVEKYGHIIGKAKSLEENARREEMLLRAKGGTAQDIQLGEHISDMLIDAIKAKLAVLSDL